MVKRILTLVFSLGLAFSMSTPMPAQETKPQADMEKAPKQDRLEGVERGDNARSLKTVM